MEAVETFVVSHGATVSRDRSVSGGATPDQLVLLVPVRMFTSGEWYQRIDFRAVESIAALCEQSVAVCLNGLELSRRRLCGTQ